MKPVSFERLQELTVITDFNREHGTDITWEDYFVAIGMTLTEVREGKHEEYKHYVRWVEIQNSPLMKALK